MDYGRYPLPRSLTSSAFVATAGEKLDFYFNYVTSDGGTYQDYGWARLLNAGDSSQAAVLFTARTKPSGSIIPGADLPNPDATLTPSNVPITTEPGYRPPDPNIPGDSGIGPVWSPLGPNPPNGFNGTCWDVGCGYTGWVQASFIIASSGNYKLQFGVINWDDPLWDSGMAFDGATIAGVSIDDDTRLAPIPEPETYAMLLAGLGLMGVLARRRKQKAA